MPTSPLIRHNSALGGASPICRLVITRSSGSSMNTGLNVIQVPNREEHGTWVGDPPPPC